MCSSQWSAIFSGSPAEPLSVASKVNIPRQRVRAAEPEPLRPVERERRRHAPSDSGGMMTRGMLTAADWHLRERERYRPTMQRDLDDMTCRHPIAYGRIQSSSAKLRTRQTLDTSGNPLRASVSTSVMKAVTSVSTCCSTTGPAAVDGWSLTARELSS